MKTLALSIFMILSAVSLCSAADQPANATKKDKPKNDIRDLQLTGDIRSKVVDDANLSSDAKRVSVEVRNGKVRLTGMVRSHDDQAELEKTVTEVAGRGNVEDRTKIKPTTPNK